MLTKARIAVLVSGGGTNLQAILDAQAAGHIPHGEVVLVVSNRTGAYALERAKAAGVPTLTLTRKACGGQSGFEAALARGVKVTGATVHYVNEIPDGGEILLQKAVSIRKGDTPEVLQRRVMEQAEWKLLPRAVEMVSRRIAAGKE